MLKRAHVLALVVALSLLASSSGLARVLWVCGMSGRVGTSCCCTRGKPTVRGTGPAIRRADCCHSTTIRARDALASERASAPEVLPASLAVLLPLPVLPHALAARLSREPARARGPPRTGPPLYIQNCALLS